MVRRPLRLRLLDVADDGVRDGDAKDDRRVHPFAQPRRDRRRDEQDVNERLVELQKEAHPFAEAPLRGHLIRAKLPQPRFGLGLCQACGRVALQQRGSFRFGKFVPVDLGKFFHGRLLVGRRPDDEHRAPAGL